MHLFDVTSQNSPVGQSAFEVHAAIDWQKPSPLQKLPILQPALDVQRHEPVAASQRLPAPHAASSMQMHRSPFGSFLKPIGQQASPMQMHARTPSEYLWFAGQHSSFAHTQFFDTGS